MLHKLTNELLHKNILTLVQTERSTTTEILRHLQEIERRRLFCEFGYGSLLDYAVKELKYSESSAYRRIQAMRLLKAMPDIEEKIEVGALNLSNLAKVQTYIKAVEKKEQRKVSGNEKQQLVAKIENQSQRQVESLIAELNPELASTQKDRPISEDRVLLSFAISKAARQKLQRLEELSGRPHDLEQLFNLMLDSTLEKFEKKRGLNSKVQTESTANAMDTINNQKLQAQREALEMARTSTAAVDACSNAGEKFAKSPLLKSKAQQPIHMNQRKYISIHAKRQIWKWAGAQCEHVSALSKARCQQRRFLQLDHVRPLARGGDSGLGNLQLLCAAHNLAKGSL